MPAKRMHDDEVDTDVDLVRRLLAAQFPRWAGLAIEPVPSSGTVNAMYRLGRDLAVRLPRVEQWAGDLLKEARWLPTLAARLPLTVPRPVATGTPGAGYPWHWCVFKWLEGTTWDIDRVDDPRAAAVALAGFVTALHRIDTAGAPDPHPGGCGTPLADSEAAVRAAIAASRGLIDTGAATAAFDAALEAPLWDRPPVWVHGDLKPGNLLVAGGELAAVIDFGGACIGDPACDLIPAWTLFAGEARVAFRATLALDEATWARGRGWAVKAVLAIPYYLETNPVMVADAIHTLEQLLADVP